MHTAGYATVLTSEKVTCLSTRAAHIQHCRPLSLPRASCHMLDLPRPCTSVFVCIARAATMAWPTMGCCCQFEEAAPVQGLNSELEDLGSSLQSCPGQAKKPQGGLQHVRRRSITGQSAEECFCCCMQRSTAVQSMKVSCIHGMNTIVSWLKCYVR